MIYILTIVELIYDRSAGGLILEVNKIDTSPNVLMESILASIVAVGLSSSISRSSISF